MSKRQRLGIETASYENTSGVFRVAVSIWIPVEEIASLSPEQAEALMCGIAKVATAHKHPHKALSPSLST